MNALPSLIGEQAVVVGAGMGGLAAAGALADHFERVLVLERDVLPSQATPRAGVPQAKHVHVLLAGGQHALFDLFPGFEDDLARTEAVALRAGLDVWTERPGYDPFPRRDLGWDSYALSRAQLEFALRQRAQKTANVVFRERCRVEECVARSDGTRVTGVRCVTRDRKNETLKADLVVDASGRGGLTLALLDSIGQALPEETTIGVDIAYASAVFAIPDDAPRDWKGVFTFPQPPRNARGGLLFPLEGNRWIVSVASRHGDRPPGDPEGFMAFARSLRTSTIYNAIKHAEQLGDVARFRFPESAYRHYERLESFPTGLLPLGDAVCRFNPVYGQGMSVAAQEARALKRLLAARAGAPDPLNGLARPFFAEATALIESPWASAAVPDFVFPETRGRRPANFEQLLGFERAMSRLAAEDPAVHKLVLEVQALLKPRSVYRDPQFVTRVQAVMAQA